MSIRFWPQRGSHKGKAVRRAIRASGARLLFLPPPDLNPIEQVFAKLKHLMRKAKERTVDATWTDIHRMTALLRLRLLLSTDFGNAKP